MMSTAGRSPWGSSKLRARFPLTSLLAALALACGCAGSSGNRITEGEQHLVRGEFDLATKAFSDALENPKITQLDRTQAEIGEARAFLGKGDLVGAETRLRRMSDQTSAKWYHLAEIAMSREDREEAKQYFAKALERTHGGDTGVRLAVLAGGEARTFEGLAAASEILEGAGHQAKASATLEASKVWRELLAGEDPAALAKRLEGHVMQLGDYPCALVLRARLLDLTGHADDAGKVWDLSGLRPPPTDSFMAWAKELRARLAIERGDSAALGKALDKADAQTAARVRGALAEGRLWRGDVQGAMELWSQTVKKGGAPAALAAAARGRALGPLGRQDDADRAWEEALDSKVEDPRLVALLAHRLSRKGDLLGACALLEGVATGALGAEQSAALATLRAGDLLREAIAAHALEDAEAVRGLAESVWLILPLEPACLEMVGRTVDEVPDVSGHTLLALQEARLVRRLRRGELAEAKALVRWSRLEQLAPAPARGRLPYDTLRRTLEHNLHAGLRRGIERGHEDDAAGLIRAATLPEGSPLLAELRACHCLESVAMPLPRGLLALPPRTTWGSLLVRKTGLRFPRVGVSHKAGAWTLHLPGGALSFKDRAAFERSLGASLEDVRWTSLHGVTAPLKDVHKAWDRLAAPTPTVEVP